jgi:hypothetical protein
MSSSSSPPSSSVFLQRVKLYLGKNNIRRFTIGKNVPLQEHIVPATFQALLTTVTLILKESGKNVEKDVLFKYQDEEGDWICFNCELEFQEMLQHCNRSQVLRIKVISPSCEEKKQRGELSRKCRIYKSMTTNSENMLGELKEGICSILPHSIQQFLSCPPATQLEESKEQAQPPQQPFHEQIQCDGCNVVGIRGTRYKV